jgi:glycosyltransferase involved in cell wall biosynthesis
MAPAVSVIIPAYNQAQFINQAIESVLAQTWSDYEIIVVNDGSTDATPQILAGYGEQLRVITQPNAGLSAARNSGLAVAQGEFIGLLDADDMWYPDVLATTVAHLTKNPSVDVVCGAWDLIDETGRTIRPPNDPSIFQARVRADFLRTIAVGNMVIPSALLLRRKIFDCCGNFDATLKGVEDWDLLIRLAAHGHALDLINAPVLHYRRHSGCLTRDPQRTEQASRQVLAKLYADERLADLRDHASIYAWLSIAGYCQEAGLEADVRRLVGMAQEIHHHAPHNPELNLRYLEKLFLISGTEQFMARIAASTPQCRSLYHWLMAQRLLQKAQTGLALRHLLKLMASQPAWLIKKMGRKLVRVGQAKLASRSRRPMSLKP